MGSIDCPRDHSILKEVKLADAFLDVCEKCGGQFFDSGEMFAAVGKAVTGAAITPAVHTAISWSSRKRTVASIATPSS